MTRTKQLLYIVEDDMTTIKLYDEIFKNAPFGVSFCQEPKYAPDFIKTLDPDVTILDLMLGEETTGLDILKQVRKRDKDTFIVVITALTDRATRAKVLRCGANDFLNKPMNIDVLKRVIYCYMNAAKIEKG
jgi:DNA-binding response OmpR family regulator